MKTKVVHKRIFFVIIIGGLLIINFGYTLYLQVTDKPVIISSLSIGWSQSKQQSEDITIPMGITDLRVCGFLESSREKFLYIHVFNMENGSFHGKSEGEFVSPGEFCSSVKIHSALSSGKYIAKIYYQRKEIAILDFEVK